MIPRNPSLTTACLALCLLAAIPCARASDRGADDKGAVRSGETWDRAAAVGQPRVVIYTLRTCGACGRAKQYFREHNIRYTEYDVETSVKGRADFDRTKGGAVPVIVVGEKRMRGFSPERFEALMR